MGRTGFFQSLNFFSWHFFSSIKYIEKIQR